MQRIASSYMYLQEDEALSRRFIGECAVRWRIQRCLKQREVDEQSAIEQPARELVGEEVGHCARGKGTAVGLPAWHKKAP